MSTEDRNTAVDRLTDEDLIAVVHENPGVDVWDMLDQLGLGTESVSRLTGRLARIEEKQGSVRYDEDIDGYWPVEVAS